MLSVVISEKVRFFRGGMFETVKLIRFWLSSCWIVKIGIDEERWDWLTWPGEREGGEIEADPA